MAAASHGSTSEPDTAEQASSELAHPHGVDPHGADANDEPSAEWGWHGEFPRATEFAGWFTAIALLLMIIGNHESNVENWWLVGLGGGLVLMLILGRLTRRGPWRR